MANLSRLIGSRIKQLRKKAKLTQEQLGEKSEIQSSYIGGVERGERNISIETLEKIIFALNISESHFFDFSNLDFDKSMDKEQLINTFLHKLHSKSSDDIEKIISIYNIVFKK